MMFKCMCEHYPADGYCQRHNVRKSETWWRLCQTHEGYRRKWEEGSGPGQEGKPRQRTRTSKPQVKRIPGWVRYLASKRTPGDRGAGDTMQRLFEAHGAHQVKKILRKLGIKDCGCGNRQANYNHRYDYKQLEADGLLPPPPGLVPSSDQ